VRSAADLILRWAIVALALTAAMPAAPLCAQKAPRAESTAQPDDGAITAALTRVKADPNLASEQTITMLRWKDATATKTRPETPSWVTWIADLFRWVDQSARVLMWCVIAGLVGLLAFYLARVVYHRGSVAGEEAFVIPSHVRELDIRPEALPPDIGNGARQLWDGGDQRGALALLYRGLLSRLAHVHRVPIRDASTEGDCLDLANRHVALRQYAYAARLVRTWQRFVYGRLDVQTESVYRLCDEFGPTLDLGAGNDSSSLGELR
jgi:hypothetical protein